MHGELPEQCGHTAPLPTQSLPQDFLGNSWTLPHWELSQLSYRVPKLLKAVRSQPRLLYVQRLLQSPGNYPGAVLCAEAEFLIVLIAGEGSGRPQLSHSTPVYIYPVAKLASSNPDFLQ